MQEHIDRYSERENIPSGHDRNAAIGVSEESVPNFLNGRQLRDYQVRPIFCFCKIEGLNVMSALI